MKGNVIQMNTLHLNSVRLNGIGKVQSVSLKGGSTEDPVFPPVEPPVEPTPTYTLSASVTNGKVSAKRNGSAVNLPFTANEGDTIVVEVTPNDGYSFEGWADGNTDNPRSITMTADVVLSAECSEVVQPPVGNYIQFEDKAVEAICVENWSSDGIGLTEEDAAAVTTIGTNFNGNTEITSFDEFKYFKNCTTLEASAFEGCSNLASLPIEHLVVLNGKALYGCSALEYDNLNLANCTTLGQNALYGVKVRKLNISKVATLPSANGSTQNYGDKSVLEEVVLGEVTKIPDYSFYAYESLKSINLDNVTYIGIYAFTNCIQLSIDIGGLNPNMTNIGVASLIGVITTGDVTLPNLTGTVSWFNYNYPDAKLIEGIEDLGQATVIAGFNNQKKMRFAKLPSTTTKIDIDCFVGCTSLKYIVCRATTPPTLANTALKNTNDCPIYVPDASLEAYKTAVNWVSFADRIHPLSEIEGDDSRLDYIHDSIFMWLDGIDKGSVEGEWQDLVGNNNFVNYGAVELANGYQFNGESYMQIVLGSSPIQWSDDTTLEVVVEFAGNSTYDVVLVSAYQNGVAFGRTQSQLIVASNNERPSYADPLAGFAAGKAVVAVNKNTALYNGSPLTTQGTNFFGEVFRTELGTWRDGYFKGKIHAIRIHDRILSEEEILYNQRIDNKRFNLGLDI